MIKIINPDEIEQYQTYEAEPTPWFTVTQEQINQFAQCTLDDQFIHTDPEKAKDTPYGTTIAHGFLTLSMLSHFASDFSLVIAGATVFVNTGFDKLRFISPVKVDSRIRALANVKELVEKKPGQYRVTMEVTVEIENEAKPALVAEWIATQIVA